MDSDYSASDSENEGCGDRHSPEIPFHRDKSPRSQSLSVKSFYKTPSCPRQNGSSSTTTPRLDNTFDEQQALEEGVRETYDVLTRFSQRGSRSAEVLRRSKVSSGSTSSAGLTRTPRVNSLQVCFILYNCNGLCVQACVGMSQDVKLLT